MAGVVTALSRVRRHANQTQQNARRIAAAMSPHVAGAREGMLRGGVGNAAAVMGGGVRKMQRARKISAAKSGRRGVQRCRRFSGASALLAAQHERPREIIES